MNKAVKWTLIGGAGAAAVLGLPVAGLMSSLGAFSDIDTAYAKTCHRITGMPGSEDIAPDYETGIAYVSSDDRRAHLAGDDKPGEIYMFNMSDGINAKPVKMTGTQNLEPFYPHGISLFKHEGTTRLFVISHRTPEKPELGHDIFIFQIEDTHLSLIEKIQDEGIRSPNDLVAVGPRQFYFTNDRKSLEGVAMLTEIMAGQAVSDVSYYDGEKSKIVAGDLAFANGINSSADRSKIYASAFRGGTTNIYDRDLKTGDLKLTKSVATGNGPDNVSVGPNGDIWVAEHPNILAVTSHSTDPKALSPVRIFKIDARTLSSSIVYEDNGANLSAVSVAVPFKDKLFLGAIYDDGVSSCQL